MAKARKPTWNDPRVELEAAQLGLDAAAKHQAATQAALTFATVDFQRALMRLCNAEEVVRRLPQSKK